MVVDGRGDYSTAASKTDDTAICFGDVVALSSLGGPCAFVSSAGLVDELAHSDVLRPNIGMPPNPRECRFFVHPAGDYSRQMVLAAASERNGLQRQPRRDVLPSQGGDAQATGETIEEEEASQIELAQLRERSFAEREHNVSERHRLAGTHVRYGDAIELHHVSSHKVRRYTGSLCSYACASRPQHRCVPRPSRPPQRR